ncbi:MAG: DUF2330 domain-containing protein [Bradyrhizobium sp.]|uniref:DUF2330 domain-containing protein n=1 Tax=Bradyrhizobium sp. TaxID=376 RepID=UPI0011FC64AD|nr:DUF2330 domain-containing protein [Bradyrhizobium sp.]THD62618.1 MAG: DUF2330 domain-containing protein [Bradyrhizobium sp.]
MTYRAAHALKTGVAMAAILAQLAMGPANAFCGFYVAQADSKLFNTSSKVVLARDGDQTAITMASDFEGDTKEFAVVVPVPTFIERKQIGVVDPKTIDHLDHYTAPRLVEYHDDDPCQRMMMTASTMPAMPVARSVQDTAVQKKYGVTIEASYDVGEYDVLILSANESNGLVNWLTDNKYRIPQGAEDVLGSYIRQNMRFFVAKVNLERMKGLGNGYLRPLQVRYQSAKFMVPLRLGTVNAKGPQDLIIYALTKNGRIESTNYRTVKIPSDIDVPLYVKDEFGPFYKALFERAVSRENMHAVFVEYAWDMGWCDPCAAEPLSNKELVELGARWIGSAEDDAFRTNRYSGGGGSDAFVTRLHVRYDARSFPEDIVFMETRDRSNFQGRYVQHHPWQGPSTCPAATTYRNELPARFTREAKNLEDLTGWNRTDITGRMALTGQQVK